MAGWFAYLVRCVDDTLYTGIARDPVERVAAHNGGRGGAYTRSRRPVRLEYVEPVADKSAALRRELQLKALSRQRKLELLASRSGVRCDAPLLSIAGFGAPHGFSTRAAGVSEGPYAGLNLGARTADEPQKVEENRRTFLGWFGVGEQQLCALEQVHGDRIVIAGEEERPQADAQLSDDPDKLLVIGAADCLPLLYFDPASGAVAAAHCGWRGTLAGLAGKTVMALSERFGTDPAELRVAIGPGICRRCYEVGEDLVWKFQAAGFPGTVAEKGADGRWHLDLAAANLHRLGQAGVDPDRIFMAGGDAPACTSCQPQLFYSHRRDRGTTGRHWAAVRAVTL